MPDHTNSSEFESELSQAIATATSAPPDEQHPPTAPLIAQVLDVAATIRMLRADLDDLETEFTRRITAIRKRLGVKL